MSIERVNALEVIISEANKFYSETGKDFIPDSEYEKLIQELKSLNPSHKLLNEMIEVKVNSLGKITHSSPMLSLDKVYSNTELLEWMNKIARNKNEKFIIGPKVDGIAARYYIKDKILATRGDGSNGEDITNKLKFINFNCDITKESGDYIDGELVISYEKFKILNSLDPSKTYKNPRNAVSGLMSQDDDIPMNIIDFIAYSHVSREFENTKEALDMVQDLIVYGFSMLYPTDGYVIKVKDETYANTLGKTTHHWKHSIAYKHANQKAITRLIDVEFNQSKSYIGITGILKPVEINGVTIKRATLHNLGIIKNLDLKINDMIEIERAGDVIPKVIRVLKDERISESNLERKEIRLETCPACNSKVEVGELFYKCVNSNCSSMIVDKIESAFRDLGGKNISTKTIEKLVKEKLVKNIYDLLKLTKSDFINLDGFSDKSSTNSEKEIIKIINREHHPANILASLNIEGFGVSLFTKLLEQTDNDYKKLLSMDVTELVNLNGLSDLRAKQLVSGVKEQLNLLNNLLLILKPEKLKLMNKQPTSSEVYTFTGKGNKTRKEYIELCNKLGSMGTDSYSSSTTTLVCEDINGSSSKLKKARKDGIKIISYSDFENMI